MLDTAPSTSQPSFLLLSCPALDPTAGRSRSRMTSLPAFHAANRKNIPLYWMSVKCAWPLTSGFHAPTTKALRERRPPAAPEPRVPCKASTGAGCPAPRFSGWRACAPRAEEAATTDARSAALRLDRDGGSDSRWHPCTNTKISLVRRKTPRGRKAAGPGTSQARCLIVRCAHAVCVRTCLRRAAPIQQQNPLFAPPSCGVSRAA